MRAKNAKRQRPSAAALDPSRGLGWEHLCFGMLVALILVFVTYAPAFNGRFVFDDFGLPFYSPERSVKPILDWIGHERPLLMLTYWWNYQVSERNTWSYHLFNILIHATTSILLFFVARRLLSLFSFEAPARDRFAAVLCLVFLLHPIQTESVAYIAGRSESLSALFMVWAYLLFLHPRREPISWRRTAAVVALYVCAIATKEHTVVLPALFVLTNMVARGDSLMAALRRDVRLSQVIAGVTLFGLISGIAVLASSASVGFRLADFTWYQYLFAQFSVVWIYVRLFLFPVGQNADYAYPVSHNLLQPATLAGLAALIAAAMVAWRYKDRYPLTWFGFLAFLILLAPTSSIFPIKDAVAERRMYLPCFALMLVAIDQVRRVRAQTVVAVSASILVLLAITTRARAHVWSSGATLWEDTLAKSPHNLRGYTHLAYGYLREGRCQDAARRLEALPPSIKPDMPLLVSWSHVYNCLNRTDDARLKLEQAAAIEPSAAVYTLIAMQERKAGNTTAAQAAVERALSLDGGYQAALSVRAELQALYKGESTRTRIP